MKKKIFFTAIVSSVLIFILLRAFAIYADAPAGDISRSGVFLADEGLHGYNAVHWVLTGHWHVKDDINHGVNSPLFMLYEYALLNAFGISLATVRYGALFLGLLALLLLFFILYRGHETAAWIALGSGVFCYPWLIYQRLALLENLLILLLLLCLYFLILLHRSRGRSKKIVAAFWIAFFAALLVKSTAIFLFPLFCYVTLSHKAYWKQTVLTSLFMVILLSGFVWFVHIRHYADDWLYYQSLHGIARLPVNPWQLLKNYGRFFAHLKLYAFMPVIYTLALLSLLYNIYHWFKKERLTLAEKLFSQWLFWGMIFLGMFAYSPPRYSLILLPAVFALNGLFINRWLKETVNIPKPILVTVALLVLSQIGFGLYRVLHYNQLYLSCFLPVMGLVPLFLSKSMLRPQPLNRILCLGILVLSIQGVQTIGYYGSLRFSLARALKAMRTELESKDETRSAVICGDSSLLAAFELRRPAIEIMFRRHRLPELVGRTRPRYLFLEDPAQLSYLQKRMPDYFGRLQLAGQWEIMNNYLHHRDAVFYRIIQ